MIRALVSRGAQPIWKSSQRGPFPEPVTSRLNLVGIIQVVGVERENCKQRNTVQQPEVEESTVELMC